MLYAKNRFNTLKTSIFSNFSVELYYKHAFNHYY